MNSLALKSNGTIVGWGKNDYGQATPPGGTYIGISAGLNYSMALEGDGSVLAWGCSNFTAPPNPEFVAIAAGYHIADALRIKGDICQWISPYYYPPPGNDYVAVAAGGDHALAIKSDGSIFGWGDNTYGQAASKSAIKSTIVERYSYDVYGKVTIRDTNYAILTTSAFGNRFMFTGREYDWETGNYYYRARYYSPKLGRFLQTDPVGYLGGNNLYTYCLNNPVNLNDPDGRLVGYVFAGACAAGLAYGYATNPWIYSPYMTGDATAVSHGPFTFYGPEFRHLPPVLQESTRFHENWHVYHQSPWTSRLNREIDAYNHELDWLKKRREKAKKDGDMNTVKTIDDEINNINSMLANNADLLRQVYGIPAGNGANEAHVTYMQIMVP